MEPSPGDLKMTGTIRGVRGLTFGEFVKTDHVTLWCGGQVTHNHLYVVANAGSSPATRGAVLPDYRSFQRWASGEFPTLAVDITAG